ncbi:1410_t:CDS:2, partial [Funneliformis mosseae]
RPNISDTGLNPSDLLERFMRFINKCSHKYETKDDYYAPYATLTQASDTGKSKLLQKTAEIVFIIYCCLRDSNTSGYPFRSHIANSLISKFEDERDASFTFLAYLCACIQKNIESRMTKIKHELIRKSNNDDEFIKEVEKYVTQRTRQTSVECLFAFDESRTLINNKAGKETLFYHFCHDLKFLPKGTGIFAIFTDTISNFAPAAHLDPSKRVAGTGSRLYEPFYLLDTIDIYTDSKELPTLEESKNPQHMLVWKALVGHWKINAQKINITEALAILGTRLCIDIVPQSEYASLLMTSHMRLCLDVSENRKSNITSMPTEPVLAEAVARIMNDSEVSLTELTNRLASARMTLAKETKVNLSETMAIVIQNCLQEQVLFIGTEFGEAYIKFTHFIRINYTPNRKDLRDALIRGVAFSCKRNQRGYYYTYIHI